MYGSIEGQEVEAQTTQLSAPTNEKKGERNGAFVAVRTVLLLLLIGAMSVLVVSVSKSYQEEQSKSSLDLTFATDANGRVTYSLLSDDAKTTLFTDFIQTYSRTYAQDAEEFNKRLAVFKANLEVSDERNRAESAVNGTGVHGVTRFMDLTAEEFYGTYLMSETTSRKLTNKRQLQHIPRPPRQLLGAGSDPTLVYVDWSESITTEVKNAGDCAGSWATAAVQQIESDAIKGGILSTMRPLSAQQILSCTPDQQGCSYGDIEDAYTSIVKPGGIYYASDYAYTADAGVVDECSNPTTTYALTLGSYSVLSQDGTPYDTERLMIAHLTDKGTLSICLDATIWSTYVSGTVSNCDGNVINHCVQVVGMYYSSATDSGFYKIRNSWGTDWGLAGYISLTYGSNVCSVANNPMYTDPVKDTSSMTK